MANAEGSKKEAGGGSGAGVRGSGTNNLDQLGFGDSKAPLLVMR
jgi:hypothetical protein